MLKEDIKRYFKSVTSICNKKAIRGIAAFLITTTMAASACLPVALAAEQNKGDAPVFVDIDTYSPWIKIETLKYNRANIPTLSWTSTPKTDESFLNKFNKAWSEVPDSDRRLLQLYNFKIIASDLVSSAIPSIKDITRQASDADQRTSWNESGGLCSITPEHKIITVSSTYYDWATKKLQTASYIDFALLHETGHGMDHCLGNMLQPLRLVNKDLSSSEAFNNATQIDDARMWSDIKPKYKYVNRYYMNNLQEEIIGRMEECAQLYAAYTRSTKGLPDELDQNNPYSDINMISNFPVSYALEKAIYDRYHEAYNGSPQTFTKYLNEEPKNLEKMGSFLEQIKNCGTLVDMTGGSKDKTPLKTQAEALAALPNCIGSCLNAYPQFTIQTITNYVYVWGKQSENYPLFRQALLNQTIDWATQSTTATNNNDMANLAKHILNDSKTSTETKTKLQNLLDGCVTPEFKKQNIQAMQPGSP